MSPSLWFNLLFYLSVGNHFLSVSLKVPLFLSKKAWLHNSHLQAVPSFSITENTPDRYNEPIEIRQIFLDTETTGLRISEKHRIIEVAAIEMINQRRTGKDLHYYLNPGRGIDLRAYQVHGIDEAFLSDKPIFKDIANELLSHIQGSELIMHSAPFDVAFLTSVRSFC